MKKAKQVLALLLCAVLLVGASVAGTLAYLTSNKTVTNTFTVGKVEITLDESVVDEYGVATSGTTDDGNEYKLIPGHTYTKDPTIHVGADSEACYLFVKVDNGIEAIEADDDTTTIASQMAALGWNEYDSENNVYVYYSTVSTVDAEAQAVPVFVSFTLADDADVAAYEEASIGLTAYAIQADGLTVDEAWAALAEKYSA